MPAVPYRDDEPPRAAPARLSRVDAGAPDDATWSDDDRFPDVRLRRPASAPPPAPPALEGLTATGAGFVGLVVAGTVALVDGWVSPGLGVLFALGFVLTSGFVGLRLRGRDSWAAFAVPPLVYIAAAGVAAQVGPLTAGSWVQRTSSDMATAVTAQWLVLLLGTLVSVVAVGYRAYVQRAR